MPALEISGRLASPAASGRRDCLGPGRQTIKRPGIDIVVDEEFHGMGASVPLQS